MGFVGLEILEMRRILRLFNELFIPLDQHHLLIGRNMLAKVVVTIAVITGFF